MQKWYSLWIFLLMLRRGRWWLFWVKCTFCRAFDFNILLFNWITPSQVTNNSITVVETLELAKLSSSFHRWLLFRLFLFYTLHINVLCIWSHHSIILVVQLKVMLYMLCTYSDFSIFDHKNIVSLIYYKLISLWLANV